MLPQPPFCFLSLYTTWVLKVGENSEGEYEYERERVCVGGENNISEQEEREWLSVNTMTKKEVRNHMGCMIFMKMCIWTMYLNLLVSNFIDAIHQNVMFLFDCHFACHSMYCS